MFANLKFAMSLGTERSSNQGQFLPIKILDRSCKRFYRQCVCDYPLL